MKFEFPSLKSISLFLLIVATIFLILNIVHTYMVKEIERGILDALPATLSSFIFFGYPAILLVASILYLFGMKRKHVSDGVQKILLIVNFVGVLVFTALIFTHFGR